MITEAQLGYMAGILDYKSTPVHKGGKNRAGGRPQLTILVESKNLAVIEKLCEMTGSTPDYAEKRPRPVKPWMRRGCVEHCPEPDIEYPGEGGLPEMGHWTQSGVAALIVLKAVQPYMTTDRGISNLIAECEEHLVTSGRGVGNVRKAVQRLKGLGWPIPDGLEARIAPPVPLLAASRHRTAAQVGLA